jgi:hypothetical protein
VLASAFCVSSSVEGSSRSVARSAASSWASTAGDEQLQVLAGVAVERGEDLVEVDVRQRLADRDDVPLLEPWGRLRAGVELGDHVLQPRLGPQQDRRVAVHPLVLGLDLQRHDRPAVLQLDLGDLADRHSGDVDGLALARRDGLRGRHLGLDDEEVLADDREPPGQRQALVGQDHGRHGERDHEQHDHGDEVAQVLANRGPHGVILWRV